ncbi:hypothetical protein [Pontixanthobacter sp.]|uniref:hypothetical protein n=1 Tax=Pontixanthobacter sp. TaxID=2792078 RepID=UPI003C7E922B
MLSLIIGMAAIITAAVTAMVLVDGLRGCYQRYRVLTLQVNAMHPACSAPTSPIRVCDLAKLPLRQAAATQSLQSA